MAVVVATLARARSRAPMMAAAVLLLIASQGLALRQAEISAIQGAMQAAIVKQTAEVRAADRVVFDLSGLMRRAPYTWGERAGNAFKVYWGMIALTPNALAFMAEDAVLGSEPASRTASRTFAVCGAPVILAADTLICETNVKRGRAFTFPLQGTLLIGTDSLTLPSSIEQR